VLVNYLLEMEALEGERQSLFTVLSELYLNALDHGVLALDSSLKKDTAGFEAYFKTRESRLARLDSGYVQFDLSGEQGITQRSILVRVEDSGAGFSFSDPTLSPTSKTALNGRGLELIRGLCESLEFEGRGNIVSARFSWNTG
jgi:anti-sigma regulatory factor (Ser/Thr protein kinase)